MCPPRSGGGLLVGCVNRSAPSVGSQTHTKWHVRELLGVGDVGPGLGSGPHGAEWTKRRDRGQSQDDLEPKIPEVAEDRGELGFC